MSSGRNVPQQPDRTARRSSRQEVAPQYGSPEQPGVRSVESVPRTAGDRSVDAEYDFVVCGAGSSGSVLARRLSDNPAVRVLLLEAGGTDEVPSVMVPAQWSSNLGSERDWQFRARPNAALDGRGILYSMGRVLGGGSSVNVMIWSRGHRADWDFFAREAGDPDWGYEAVLDLYRRVEDYQGDPDPEYRGAAGPMWVQPAPEPTAVAGVALAGWRAAGIPTFRSPNGAMMEGDGGCAITDVTIRNGRRQSVYQSYVRPVLPRPNLTVLTDALVTRVALTGNRATGVEFTLRGEPHSVRAASEVVLSLGAIETPKVLMQSGIGDETELGRFGIPIVAHLPGVGQNLQDHPAFICNWQPPAPLSPLTGVGQAVAFWKSTAMLEAPDLFAFALDVPFASAENAARFGLPADAWAFFGGLLHPKSRGRVRLTGPRPEDPVDIDPAFLSDPEDLSTMLAGMEMLRGIGNSAELRPYVAREVMPGAAGDEADRVRFLRDGAVTFWHQSCTAKMGQDASSVVDSDLKVYGVEGLRVADASIMPRVPTGNTMAPSVVVGERAADILSKHYSL